jgi:hypothetical protein
MDAIADLTKVVMDLRRDLEEDMENLAFHSAVAKIENGSKLLEADGGPRKITVHTPPPVNSPMTPQPRSILGKERYFVMEGDLVKKCQSGKSVSYRFFLFSDQLVYTHRAFSGEYKVRCNSGRCPPYLPIVAHQRSPQAPKTPSCRLCTIINRIISGP